jgi:translocator protein
MKQISWQQVGVFLTFVASIAVNFFATPFSGTTNTTVEEVFREELRVLFNPAPIAVVLIWFLVIFPALGAFSVFQLLPAQRNHPMISPFRGFVIANSLLSIGWILSVQNRADLLTNVFAIGLLATTLAVVIKGRYGLNAVQNRERWLILVPFSVYLAWLSVATVVGITGFLDASGVSLSVLSAQAWTILLMIVTAALGLGFMIFRHDFPFVLVILYGLSAITLEQRSNTGIVTAGSLLLCAMIIAIVVFALRNKAKEQRFSRST